MPVSLLANDGGRQPGIRSPRESQLACIIARKLRGDGNQEILARVNRSSRDSLLAYQGWENEAIVARVYRGSDIRREGSDFHSPRVSHLACIIAGRFTTPRTRFRIVGRADGNLRVSQVAGLPPIACIKARVYPCSQIRGGWPGKQVPRVSHLACIVARLYPCSQITGGRYLDFVARAHRSSRVSLLAFYGRGGNQEIIACANRSLHVSLPAKQGGGG